MKLWLLHTGGPVALVAAGAAMFGRVLAVALFLRLRQPTTYHPYPHPFTRAFLRRAA